MSFDLSNMDFCIQLMYNFPFASNDETETMLADFIDEKYIVKNKEWIELLYGKSDECGNDIEPWNGKTIKININNFVDIYVEFHNTETIYFMNDEFIGNSGGHFCLSLLKWSEFKNIVFGRENQEMIFWILLPFVVGKEEEREEISIEILSKLKDMNFEEVDLEKITDYLVCHCVAGEEDLFYFDEEIGVLCKKTHSSRNIKYGRRYVKEINELIDLAQKH